MKGLRKTVLIGALAGLAIPALFASLATAEDPKYDPKMITCRMVYNLSGWSLVVKRQTGEGHVTCDDGQAFDVKLDATGVGLTAGKGKITGGRGKFTPVANVDELLGTYASAEASAGATDAGQGIVLTKGEVSLSLAGSGQGIEIGASIGGLTIERK